ncbi:MAG: DUF4199 domain-containing protein [Bacteroidia bacterium]|nr:DUF4199 domain-containing protein [Bacteroidia bacterium]
MKKVVLKFGLIAGVIPALWFCLVPLFKNQELSQSMAIGWVTYIAAGLFVFFGIKSYRDNYNDGIISFGKAFTAGLLIALLAAVVFVIIWEIMFFNFFHDMMDGYFTMEMDRMKASGASADEIEKSKAFWEMYKNNPLMNGLMTLVEPLTPSIPIALISSFILKRKTKKEAIA